MGLKVIGAGFGRTATKSLKLALERLGFDPCYHMFEVFEHHLDHIGPWSAAHNGESVDWDDLFAGYEATVDWPSANLWRELAEFYPASKVILTTREPVEWHDSVLRTIYPSSTSLASSGDPRMRQAGEWIAEIIWQGVFDGRIEDQDYAIEVFNAHVEEVIATIPAERLLVVDGKQAWAPLCEFLGCEVPAEPYPVSNTTQEFQTRIAKRKRDAE